MIKNTDLDKYLKSLKMKLHIRTCTHVDYAWLQSTNK